MLHWTSLKLDFKIKILFRFPPFVISAYSMLCWVHSSGGWETTKLTQDCCTRLPVTKWECVRLRPAWSQQPLTPVLWQRDLGRNLWNSTHSWSHCHFKTEPGITSATQVQLSRPSLMALIPHKERRSWTIHGKPPRTYHQTVYIRLGEWGPVHQ